MNIGALAKLTGVDVPTIRYYEQAGLLCEPPRSAAGYRQYGHAHHETLQFIRRCRSLDMSLAEVRSLLEFRQHPERACEDVERMVATHVAAVRERIVQLQRLEQQLLLLQASCGAQRSAENCGILQSLNSAADAAFNDCHRPISHRKA